MCTPLKTHIFSEKGPFYTKGNVHLNQPSIFRGYVSFQGCLSKVNCKIHFVQMVCFFTTLIKQVANQLFSQWEMFFECFYWLQEKA